MQGELHDELGQILTALRMDAVWLRRRLTGVDAPGEERAEAMCRLIDSSITEVGGLARRLRPAVLDDLGLVEGLEWYAGRFRIPHRHRLRLQTFRNAASGRSAVRGRVPRGSGGFDQCGPPFRSRAGGSHC